MVVKVYISGISGNKEVKKRQQRVLMILDSKSIKYDVIDITEPGRETDKDFMQINSKNKGGTVSDPDPRSPLPPQVFNDDEYCGDYDQFDMANEVDTLEQFLKLEVPPEAPTPAENGTVGNMNGNVGSGKQPSSKESSQERDSGEGDSHKSKEPSPVEEVTKDAPSKEGTPAGDGAVDKESTPSREATPVSREGSQVKETAVKEISPERQKSVEPDEESKVASKENTPPKDERSSHEKSVEKDNPSEALIKSEQEAASE